MPSPRYLTPAQVAKELNIHPQTMRRYLREDRFPGTVRLNNSPRAPYRVPETALTEWAKRNQA
jgi:predicted site-specific integrase-resolvase